MPDIYTPIEKTSELTTLSDINGALSLILCEVEGPLSWFDKGCRKLLRAFCVVRMGWESVCRGL